MRHRVDKLRRRIRELDLDCFLISSPHFIRYFFGFSGSNAISLTTPDACYFITDRRYIQQSAEQVTNAEIIIAEQDLLTELSGLPVLNGLSRMGIEAQHLSVRDYFVLKKKLRSIKLMATERILERIVSVKEPEEVDSIRKAASICLEVIHRILEVIKPGVQELDISAEISYKAKKLGSEKDPFEPIVASGRRSALPHGISSAKKMESGELVIIDFGATVDGYAADFTRTISIGKPSQEQSELAEVVESALIRSEEAATPGITGKDLDGIARAFIESKGYGEQFQHSLGHGLGLSVHELPRIGEISQDRLEAGNVITLEPGIYVPGFGGVRIEDDFVVSKNGVENLTPISRGLMSV